MIEFEKWMIEGTLGTDDVNSQIDALYDKAKYAVRLVQLYSSSTKKGILKNISTIAPLHAGVYGLYNSRENKKVIGPAASNKIKFKFGQEFMNSTNLQNLPNAVIKKYIPDIDEGQLTPSDVIHVNVKRIVAELGDSFQSVLEIASTIVHEATHELEFQKFGKTDENGPRRAEAEFKAWVTSNRQLVLSRIPQIAFSSLSPHTGRG